METKPINDVKTDSPMFLCFEFQFAPCKLSF
jgi:hypothetical protein